MTASVEFLSSWLRERIARGDAILFLGAGATFGAEGGAPLSSDDLRDRIADRFLGGAMKKHSLARVAELAKNESNLFDVQAFVATFFSNLFPADFHKQVAQFRWASIVTTNYDLVVERAYQASVDREQQLVPIYGDDEDFEKKIRAINSVPFLKLHGCISRIRDKNLPLILASEEYAKHRKNRDRMFRRFSDWAKAHPVIFCGYQIEDPNLQQILFDIGDSSVSRPPYVVVDPFMEEVSVRYWTSKRFLVRKERFSDFMQALNVSIPKSSRKLATIISHSTLSIGPWVMKTSAPTDLLLAYLAKELVHVHKGMPTSGPGVTDFYRGQSDNWLAYAGDLDVRRSATDDLISVAVIGRSAAEKSPEFYLLKGYAGSGKSVCLRRFCWDVANLFDGFVFFLGPGGMIRRELLEEIHLLTNERVLLVLDDIVPLVDEASALLAWARSCSFPLTLVAATRTNEWNVVGDELDAYVRRSWELKDLSESEITRLIEKLSDKKCLGRLADADDETRRNHFRLTAERQLLVALFDMDMTKTFEEIVLDEYQRVLPAEARAIYLDVATLHRLGVSFRAGLLSRVTSIGFERFESEFFAPLEHVVRTLYDSGARDYAYRTRHRSIAEAVFARVLQQPEQRSEQLARIVRCMDIDYSSDAQAFDQIVSGREFAELFNERGLAYRVFDAAEESGAPVAYIDHQRAVFELHHRNGDAHLALRLIEKAQAAISGSDRTISHTKAMALRRLANDSRVPLERQKLREEAKSILRKQLQGSRKSHPYSTMAQIALDELSELLASLDRSADFTDRDKELLASAIREANEAVSVGLDRYPADSFLLALESELARKINQDKRALKCLAAAFRANPGKGFVAVRLARGLEDTGAPDEALAILRTALEANPGARDVHLGMAKLLMHGDESTNRAQIEYHLVRSFTPGDSNLDAQFWYARHQFLFGDRAKAHAAFRITGAAIMPPSERRRVRGLLRSGNRTTRLQGSIKSLQAGFGFIVSVEYQTNLFFHASELRREVFSRLRVGDQVTFKLGFTMRGPVAIQVRLPNAGVHAGTMPA